MSRRKTMLRETILDVIQHSSGHMTADQIHSTLKDKGVSIGIATVYRNLNVLYDDDLINRVKHPDFGFIYDKNLHHHYHFKCIECGEFEDVNIRVEKDLYPYVMEQIGAQVTTHDIIFEGVCKKCLAKKKKD